MGLAVARQRVASDARQRIRFSDQRCLAIELLCARVSTRRLTFYRMRIMSSTFAAEHSSPPPYRRIQASREQGLPALQQTQLEGNEELETN